MSVAQEALGKQIKAAREDRRWTQEELGKRCGVGKAQISKIEKDLTHASMALFLKICEVFGFDPVIRMQQDLPAETIEVLDEGLWLSLPYVEDSIQRITYAVQGERLELIIYPNDDGLLFSADEVIFTNGSHLPVLEEEEIQDMEQERDNTVAEYIISIPYEMGSIKQVSYIITGNYFHLGLHGSITPSFDESEVSFTRVTK